jgi:hypothetical protein
VVVDEPDVPDPGVRVDESAAPDVGVVVDEPEVTEPVGTPSAIPTAPDGSAPVSGSCPATPVAPEEGTAPVGCGSEVVLVGWTPDGEVVPAFVPAAAELVDAPDEGAGEDGEPATPVPIG